VSPAPAETASGSGDDAASASTTGFVFAVGGELYGVDLDEVVVAVGVAELLDVPWTPAHVLGVQRIQGGFEAIISLQRVLGIPEEGPGDAPPADDARRSRSRVLLLRAGDLRAGIVVDRIEDVAEVGALTPCPPGTRGQVAVYARGVGRWRDGFVCWLSAERLLQGTALRASL